MDIEYLTVPVYASVIIHFQKKVAYVQKDESREYKDR